MKQVMDIAKSALCLGLLMAAAGTLLAAVNAVTQDRIDANHRIERRATLKELTGLDVEMATHSDVVACEQDLVVVAIVERGYGGSMDVVVGFHSRALVGVRVTRHTETPGFADILKPSAWIGELASDGDVDTVSGATITSAAVLRATDAAARRYEANAPWCAP